MHQCPYTGNEIRFPPCFVMPERSNPEFSRDSVYHKRFVHPFVPESVTLENLILDELFLCEKSADEQKLLSRVRENPFICYDDELTLFNVISERITNE